MDDWSLLPSRTAVSDAAPDPQSPMNTTSVPCQTHPPASSAPQPGADRPRPRNRALDPAELAWQQDEEAGAEPRNPSNTAKIHRSPQPSSNRKQKIPRPPLDTSRPFMDDIGVFLAAGAAACAA